MTTYRVLKWGLSQVAEAEHVVSAECASDASMIFDGSSDGDVHVWDLDDTTGDAPVFSTRVENGFIPRPF